MASPTAVMLAWIDGNRDKTKDWTEREYFDAGRMSVCMEVLSSLRTLRSFDSEEYGYALAVGALEGVLQRMGVELRAYETYDSLSRWRRESARRDAYDAGGWSTDAAASDAAALVDEALRLEGSQTSPALPRSLDDPSV